MSPSDHKLDDLLTDFFHAQMPRSWPAAPVPGRAVPARPAARRAALAATSGVRARLTLAASVGLLLGTCWYLSSGWSAGDRTGTPVRPGGGPNVWPDATAKTPEAFEKARQDKAAKTADPMSGFQPGPITLP